jgi:hypothetical protein
VFVRLTADELAVIDGARGEQHRAAYLRDAAMERDAFAAVLEAARTVARNASDPGGDAPALRAAAYRLRDAIDAVDRTEKGA